jgi:hypothetical protein
MQKMTDVAFGIWVCVYTYMVALIKRNTGKHWHIAMPSFATSTHLPHIPPGPQLQAPFPFGLDSLATLPGLVAWHIGVMTETLNPGA